MEYNGGKVEFTEEMLAEGELEITDKATGNKLVYGTDFIIVGYKNNTKKGTATIDWQETVENRQWSLAFSDKMYYNITTQCVGGLYARK